MLGGDVGEVTSAIGATGEDDDDEEEEARWSAGREESLCLLLEAEGMGEPEREREGDAEMDQAIPRGSEGGEDKGRIFVGKKRL